MILLKEMTEADFVIFKPFLVEDYAHDLARNYHISIEEARLESAKQTDGFLSQGLATPNNALFNILNEEGQVQEKVGYLWIEVQKEKRRCFIYDIFLYENFRGRGFGKQTLELLDSMMRDQGIERIGLHVFAHNTSALELYKKMGYELTGYNMQKWL